MVLPETQTWAWAGFDLVSNMQVNNSVTNPIII